MQVFAHIGIILCLVVSIDMRSVEIAEGETSVGENKLLHRGLVQHEILQENSSPDNAETCKCENGFCEEAEGKLICKCHPEWGKYTSTQCRKCECGKNSNCTFGGFWGTKTCLCKVGYEDSDGICKGTCKTNPCKNGGICVVKGSDIECECKPPFIGEMCKTTECRCQNGKCQEINGKLTCVCNPEFGLYEEGICKQCECGKDSNCTFTGLWSTKTCLCKEGYEDSGGICKGTCKTNPCKNGGLCVLNGEDVECKCKQTFTGERCETTECRCQNGKCQEINGKLTCVCNPEFGLYEEGICKACECGKGANCTFDPGLFSTNKRCICPKDFNEHSGKCREVILYTSPIILRTSGLPFTVSGTTEGRTRNLSTTTPTESSSVHELKTDTVTTIKPDVSAVSIIKFTTPNDQISKDYSLNDTDEMDRTLQTTTQTQSTHTDLCAINPCRNGGICKMEGNETRCYCISPFTGDVCEKDPCFSNPCMHGGLCKINGTSFLCECSSPYSGRFCEKDPCSKNPCHNGGTCVVIGNSSKCLCKDPFAGLTCETDPCEKNPCQNGGTCFVSGNRFKCMCREPFVGNLCEADPCVWNPCKNGGICKIENSAVKCFCKEPFTGEFCESRSDLCVWNPCKNGGVCKTENEAVKCFCKQPFTGEFCDSHSGLDANVITFAAFSVLLIIFLTVVSCILCQRLQILKMS